MMGRLKDSAPQVGLGMGLFLTVVGVVLDNWGIVGLGFAILLVGYFGGRSADEQ